MVFSSAEALTRLMNKAGSIQLRQLKIKLDAAGKEVAIAGVGIGGDIAGGALAGLACGPGSPVCVTVGAFVGGALAEFGMGLVW